jgi:type VI secretion system protein ImpK
MLDMDTFGDGVSRTFVVPNPGGKTSPVTGATVQAAFFNAPDELPPASNVLMQVASPVLNMIYQVRTLVHNSDPSQLRNYLIDEIKKFEQRAKAEFISPDIVATARYCLCTVIDETAAQTPWGGGGVWAKFSLLVTFHNETWGGEKFFQILAQIAHTPAVHRDLIELLYCCISLGFEGRYKIVTNGASQLELLRRRLIEILNDVKGEKEKSFSLHWQGIVKPRPPVWTILPVWVSALFCCMGAAILFIFLTYKLSDASDRVFSQIIATPIPVISVSAKRLPSTEGQITILLQDEIAKGLVYVHESTGIALVTLVGDGLFSSGSIAISPLYAPIIKKIGFGINQYGKGAVISGYTDNTPIRSARFPSNWHLSVERANAVSSQLKTIVNGSLNVQGLGEADPVATNSTVEGRALNRRVEIRVFLNAVK